MKTITAITRVKDESGRGNGLCLEFSNNTRVTIPSEKLRRQCPCALCAENRGEISHNKPLSQPTGRSRLMVVKADLQEETNLVSIRGIGTYAIGLTWGDGHKSGVYNYSYLLELGNVAGS